MTVTTHALSLDNQPVLTKQPPSKVGHNLGVVKLDVRDS